MPSKKRKEGVGQLAALIESSQTIFKEAAKSIAALDSPPSHSKERTIVQPDNRTAAQTIGQLFRQLPTRTIEQLAIQADKRTSGQFPEQSNKRTIGQEIVSVHPAPPIDKKPIDLTIRQFKILHYIYFNRPFSVHSKYGPSKMQVRLQSPYQSIRNNIKSLLAKGYIEKPFIVISGNISCQTCRVNLDKCTPLFGPSGIPEPTPRFGRPDNWTTGQITEQPDNRTTGQSPPPIEDSLLLKKLTSEVTFLKVYFGEKPHLKFWLDRGLSGRNLSDWSEKCKCDLQTLLRYMDRCHFEMVELGRETKHSDTLKPINNVPSYFWKIISSSGYYPKPKGYISAEQKQIVEAQRAKNEAAEETKALETALREKRGNELKVAFLRPFSDTDSEVYKKCYKKLNSFQLQPANKNNPERFFNNMFLAFNALVDSGEISI